MPRLIEAPLEIEFDLFLDNEEFVREYNSLSESDDDPVGQWLKIAKARGETSESDQVLLTLLVELHRKVDDLSAYIKNEKTDYLKLTNKAQIDSIGFDNIHVKKPFFATNKVYYGRILMPIFPKREVPMFFKGIDGNLAQIQRLHDRDRKDWDAYVTARERVMIRQMKAKKDGN